MPQPRRVVATNDVDVGVLAVRPNAPMEGRIMVADPLSVALDPAKIGVALRPMAGSPSTLVTTSVIPFGLEVKVDDLKPGSYRLVVQAVDSAKNNAPSRTVDFDIMEKRRRLSTRSVCHDAKRVPS